MSEVTPDGIINVLKPPGMTSHDVVNFLRRTMKIKKAGHTGTLDPGVAGVLPVCLGKATRIVEYLSEEIKQYRAEVTFGRSTDTQDGFGKTVRLFDASGLTEKQVEDALLSLQGQCSQIPPMVSALKYKGRRLYEIAREGMEIEREPRLIRIFKINIIKCSGFGTPNPRVLFDIKCSKGTYVRTVCHDVGEILSCGGFMSFLVRMWTGRFHISCALTLEEITEMIKKSKISEVILPLDEALPFEPVWIYDEVIKYVCHGNRIFLPGIEKLPDKLEENQLVKLINRKTGCLAVARVMFQKTSGGPSLNNNSYMFQPIKVFC